MGPPESDTTQCRGVVSVCTIASNNVAAALALGYPKTPVLIGGIATVLQSFWLARSRAFLTAESRIRSSELLPPNHHGPTA